MKKMTLLFLGLFLLTGCSTVSLDTNRENYTNSPSKPISSNPREAINNYLLSQQDFVWQTESGSKNLCAFYPFNKINESEVYLWVRCSEVNVKDGVLLELSGVSGPAKLSSLGGDNYSHQIPGDGASYGEDLEEMFPEDILEKVNKERELYLVNANSDILEQAKEYFGVAEFLEVPNSFIQHCQQDSDCITPMNYLIRSNCPYGSKCMENRCEIVCEY